jgi:PhnB protein
MSKPQSVQPYLVFNGRCEEAIEFYRKAIGAEVEMMLRFKEAPDKSMITPGCEEKIMHATLKIGASMFFASDGRCEKNSGFSGFSLSLGAPDEAAAKTFFNSLAEGGQIHMPLTKTFFSPCFGMVADRFGVSWMVIVHQQNDTFKK